MEEQFDVIDENNQPLDLIKTRSEVHRDGDWHRVVHVYLFNNKGEFPVHLRSTSKDQSPNRWDTRFGDHLKAGETFEEAAVKEIKDEVGLSINLSETIEGNTYKRDGGSNREFTKVYYLNFRGDLSGLKFNDNEVVEVKWMSKEEIVKELQEKPERWTTTPERFLEVAAALENILATRNA